MYCKESCNKVSDFKKDVNRIENILLCNVGASVGMNIPISQVFLNKPISELHFYYDMKQKNGFRED